jgi:hypothetical protein
LQLLALLFALPVLERLRIIRSRLRLFVGFDIVLVFTLERSPEFLLGLLPLCDEVGAI